MNPQDPAGIDSPFDERGAESVANALPPVWNIRRLRNTGFRDRQEELEALGPALKSHRIVVVTGAIPGTRGIGKTELALEYAYRAGRRYQVIWWVDGHSAATLKTRYAQLEDALVLVSRSPELPIPAIEAVRDRLSQHSGWLLVVDGLLDFELLNQIVPDRAPGHVIVTADNVEPGQGLHTMELAPLTVEATAEFLDLPMSDDTATRLHNCLQGSPLLLDLVRRYSATARVTLDKCVRLLPANGLQRAGEEAGSGHVVPLCRILMSMGLQRLTRKDKAPRDLLQLLSYLAPTGVGLDVLKNGAGVLSKRLTETIEDGAMLTACLKSLESFGFVRVENETIFIHPVVQDATRGGLNHEPRKAWATAALRLVARSFPLQKQYVQPSPVCTRLLPHIFEAVRHAEELKVCKDDRCSLLYLTGLYLHGCRHFEEAIACYERSIELGEELYGEFHPTLAVRTNSLGVAHQESGRFTEAERYFERAVMICEKAYGPTEQAVYTAHDESMLTMPVRNLCHVIEQTGDIEAAQRTYQRAMKLFLKVYAWNHPMVAECANNFGRTWLHLDNLEKARNCFEKAVQAEENSDEPEPGVLSEYLTNLGTALLRMRNESGAHEQFQRALRLDMRDLPEDDPRIGRDLANVGHTHSLKKEFAKSIESYEGAIEIHRRHYGSDTVHVARLVNHLGNVYLAADDPERAKSRFEEALAMYSALYGRNDASVVQVLINLSKAYKSLQSWPQARGCLERALNIERTNHGVKSGEYATIQYRIGRLLHNQGAYDEAITHLRDAMSIDQSVLGKEHPNVARDAHAIGNVLIDRKETVVAMGHLTMALDIYESTVGRDDPRTRKVRRKLDELTL